MATPFWLGCLHTTERKDQVGRRALPEREHLVQRRECRLVLDVGRLEEGQHIRKAGVVDQSAETLQLRLADVLQLGLFRSSSLGRSFLRYGELASHIREV